ncbi:hypothetical protein NEMBOFW57_005636 [Staphylotrichum longicolle]|uniref:CFEM domain-containing protein n=1 Tax=Staphylotrichum longicolle TaxID=669026 RepID=A0AAD4EX21_9PEZI|nr:hypothetical protein NEMBOFW57_005636 [Staphylotrichum longicolle]
MQFTTFAVIALAAVASAGPAIKRQTACPEADNIPACGETRQYPCIASAVTELGCAADDYTCMCSKFNDLQLAAAGCVYSNCGLAGVSAVLSAAQAVCAACA